MPDSVIVTDTLPVSVTFNGGSDGCGLNGADVVCTAATLAAGTSQSYLIQVRVNAAAANGLVLANSVTATSPTAPAPATDSENTTVQQPSGGFADLVLRNPARPRPGHQIAYTVIVTNNGPSAAQNVRVIDGLPSGTTFVAATASAGTCTGGVTCEVGDLANGASATVWITGTVNGDATGILTNTAQAGQQWPTTRPRRTRRRWRDKDVTPAVPGDRVTYRSSQQRPQRGSSSRSFPDCGQRQPEHLGRGYPHQQRDGNHGHHGPDPDQYGQRHHHRGGLRQLGTMVGHLWPRHPGTSRGPRLPHARSRPSVHHHHHQHARPRAGLAVPRGSSAMGTATYDQADIAWSAWPGGGRHGVVPGRSRPAPSGVRDGHGRVNPGPPPLPPRQEHGPGHGCGR